MLKPTQPKRRVLLKSTVLPDVPPAHVALKLASVRCSPAEYARTQTDLGSTRTTTSVIGRFRSAGELTADDTTTSSRTGRHTSVALENAPTETPEFSEKPMSENLSFSVYVQPVKIGVVDGE